MASLLPPTALAVGGGGAAALTPPGAADLAASIERVSAALKELGDTVTALRKVASTPASLKRPRSAADLGRAAKAATLAPSSSPAAALAGIGAAAGESAARALATALAAAAALGPAPVPAGPLARAVAAATTGHMRTPSLDGGGGGGGGGASPPRGGSSDDGTGSPPAAPAAAGGRPRRAAAMAPPAWRTEAAASVAPAGGGAATPAVATVARPTPSHTRTPSRSVSGMDGLLDAIDELGRREAAAASGGSPPPQAATAAPPPPPLVAPSPPPSTFARTGSWTDSDKAALLRLANERAPRGAGGWAALAAGLGRGAAAGPSAERMFRTLTDPGYARAASSHGRRIGPRSGTPMAVMAAAALASLPGRRGNLAQIADAIQAMPEYAPLLDWSPRPGTKTYPRWKDALVGCFKAGRYPHLAKTGAKDGGLNVYALVAPLPPAAVAAVARVEAAAAAAAAGGNDSPPAARQPPPSPPSPESHASAPSAVVAAPAKTPPLMTVTAHVTAARPSAPAAPAA